MHITTLFNYRQMDDHNKHLKRFVLYLLILIGGLILINYFKNDKVKKETIGYHAASSGISLSINPL